MVRTAAVTRRVVWFHRARAVGWLLVGAVSFPMGWSNSIALVWVASFYANITGDWGAAEAADDRDVTERLERLDDRLARIERALNIPPP